MSLVVTLRGGRKYQFDASGPVKLTFPRDPLTGSAGCVVKADDSQLQVDLLPVSIECIPPPTKRRRRLQVHVDDTDEDEAEDAAADDAEEPFVIRVGDIVLVKLEPRDGLLLVTDAPAQQKPNQKLHGLWLYDSKELPDSLGVAGDALYAFSTHSDTQLYDAVLETCRPLDWIADGVAAGESKVTPLMYDPQARRFLSGVQSSYVLGWAAAASKDVGEVRAAILNQVGPLLGGKYGQVMDELALCGVASSSKSAVIKREIIQHRALVSFTSPRLAKTKLCWACGLKKPLCATVTTDSDRYEVGRCCAKKLQCLSELTGVLETFLVQPFDPDTVLDFIENANAALTPP